GLGLSLDLRPDPLRVGQVLVRPEDRSTGARDDRGPEVALMGGRQHARIMRVEAADATQCQPDHRQIVRHGASVTDESGRACEIYTTPAGESPLSRPGAQLLLALPG